MKVILSLVLLIPSLSWAAFSNYNSILIGDRASGMGGAGTAVVGDASACTWYNPATCALLKGKSFSAAVGIYKKFDTVYGDNEDLTKAGLRVNQGFFRALPSSTGSIIRFDETLPDWTFAFSIVTPEYESFKGDISSSLNSKTTLSLTDESLWVGLSASRKVSASEAMGLTLYYTARSFTKSLTDRTFVSSTQSTVFQEDKAFTQNALVAILGYHKTLNEHWSLGTSFRFPSIHVAGSATYFDNLLDSGTTVSTNNLPALSTNSHIPAKLAFGVVYEEIGSILIAADVSAYSTENYPDLNSDVPGVAEQIEHRQTVNGSLGMDFVLKQDLRMRIGAFTNFSAHPDPDVTKVRGQGDHIDQLGWAANFAFKSEAITYTFGGYYTGGRGRSAQRINQVTEVVNKTQQIFTMLVGTSYSY